MRKNLFAALSSCWAFAAFAQSNPPYVALPGKIEAESYQAMSGVQPESTADAGGGQNVTWMDDNDWMDYHVNVPLAGIYTFNFRVANAYADLAKIELRGTDGAVLGSVSVPRTGGWQSWKTIATTASLPAGDQVLRIHAVKGDWNLNWFDVAGSKPFPAKIEAEDYAVATSVQTEAVTDAGDGQNVTWIDDNDWIDYNLNVAAAGFYAIHFRVANSYGNGKIELQTSSGTVLATLDVPQTGGWQSWQTISTTATLSAGSQVVRLYAVRGAWNLNWFEAMKTNALPGKVEAESYSTMSGIHPETALDEDGGQDITWIDDNDWMDYNVNVTSAGLYTFRFRVANAYADQARLELRNASGVILGSIPIPRTGGWQSWSTISTTASLPAGNQVLRIHAVKGDWNLNWFSATGSKALPGKIEAEAVDVSTEVRTETTADAGGGQNVTWIDDNDWMDYNVDVASAGVYTVTFRVANSYGNGKIELRNANTTVLATLDVPQTGGWQSWQTISTTVTLSAGSQVVRLYAVRGAWNLNWFEVVSGGNIVVPVHAVITFEDLPTKAEDDAPFDLTATTNNPTTPITYTSSNPTVVSVSNSTGIWKATLVKAGTATITASQAGNANFIVATDVVRQQVLLSSPVAPGKKIPITAKRWYQLNNASNGLGGLFDGVTNVTVETGWGKILNNYDAYYPLLNGESMTIESVQLYDFLGMFQDQPMTLSVITDQWQRIPIATFTGQDYDTWVGPYPGRQTTGTARFKLDTAVSNVRYLVINSWGNLPTEINLFGTYTPSNIIPTPVPAKSVKLKDMFGVNAYEWNFEDGNTPWQINEAKMNIVKSFAGVRHYMDWEKLESTEGSYSYNPTLSGGWNYDAIYERCKAEGIEVVACLKTIPGWMVDTYPNDEKDGENVPLRYGKDFSDPLSYLEQARVGFQYMARYGNNPNVDPALVSVNTTPRWNGDNPNTVKIGLGLIKYIECENERDKWWKGRKAYQTAREYAANLSAFYDGHKNTMGAGVGVRNADPTVKVVIGGLASASMGSDYVKGMIDWCKQYRGYKPDGTVNLCWDIINYHMYSDNTSSSQSGNSTRGAAPEVTPIHKIAEDFMTTAHQQSYDMPVWVTETGYDIHQSSPLRAIPIGSKSALQTQGDWVLRTGLFYARQGIEKVFYYQLYDDNDTGGMFGTSGLANGGNLTRRPAADYLYQTNKLFGQYTYKETLLRDPFVDRYELEGNSIYVMVVPDEQGRTANYTLNLTNFSSVKVYTPKVGSDSMDVVSMPVSAGQVTIPVTETPVFVVPQASVNNRLSAGAEKAEDTTLGSLRLYPNPSAGYVHVALDNANLSPLEVQIYDLTGGHLGRQVRWGKTSTSFSGKLDFTALPNGLYLVEVKQGSERALHKILKTH